MTIEKDGSIYSCERFVYPEFKLGNLNDKNCQLADMVYFLQQREFGCNKHTSLPCYCKRCKYLFACHGECPKNHLIKTPDGQPGLNYLCLGNSRLKGRTPIYFDFGRSKINLNHPNVAGVGHL